MKTRIGLAIVCAVIGLVLTGCFGIASSQLTVTAESNGVPLAGVDILVDGSSVGSTGADGTVLLDVPIETPTTISAQKALFQSPAVENITATEAETEVTIELEPFIFVPDFLGTEVHMLTAVDADPATFETIGSVDHGGSTYTLTGPINVHADYDSGNIYILDAANRNTAITLIRLTSFPPAPDGSEADLVLLDGGASGVEVRGSQQIVVESDGSVVLIDYRASSSDPNQNESRIVRVPSDLDHTATTYGSWFTGGGTLFLYGLTKLPNGRLFAIGGGDFTFDELLLDDVSDTTAAALLSWTEGSGTDQARIPTRLAQSVDGTHLYISDTGGGGTSNDRIIRTSTSGTGFSTFGTPGSGTDQFNAPVLLGVLPDNRLYVMDTQNNRLVRVDPGVFDGGASGWVESDIAATFSFEYWFSFS